MANYCEHCGSVVEHEKAIIEFGDLRLSPSRIRLSCRDFTIPVTPREGDMLFDLMTQAKKGSYSTKEAMLMRYFSEDVDEKIIDVMLVRLRRKIESLETECRIETLWGTGYEMTYRAAGRNTFSDIIVDEKRMVVICENRSNHLKPAMLAVLLRLMKTSFVPLTDAMELFPNNRDPDTALRRTVMWVREALKNVGSHAAIITTNSRAENVTAGYWLKSRAKAVKTEVYMTPRQREFFEVWKEHPLLSYEELAKLTNCTGGSHAYRFAKVLVEKGFADDIMKQREEFLNRDLTPTQEKFWNLLKANPNMSRPKLAKLAGCKPAACYKMIDALKAKGYAAELPNRRNTLVAIDPNAMPELKVAA